MDEWMLANLVGHVVDVKPQISMLVAEADAGQEQVRLEGHQLLLSEGKSLESTGEGCG